MSLSEIQSSYPEYLRNRGAFLLREYLQHKILELLFNGKYAQKFAFLGGTCLRIVHNNQRFSEDLDFDNFDLTAEDFEKVSSEIQAGLEKEGYEVEMRNVIRGTYHCYIRFPGLLFEKGLSGHREAKIQINLDTEPQGFPFEPDSFFLNRFDVFSNIQVTPLDLLLSQKFVAIMKRRRTMGRDFFDAVFLLGKTKPNYAFLKQRLDISTPEQLKKELLAFCEQLDFQQLARDVQPFLFDNKDRNRVEQFPNYIRTAALG